MTEGDLYGIRRLLSAEYWQQARDPHKAMMRSFELLTKVVCFKDPDGTVLELISSEIETMAPVKG